MNKSSGVRPSVESLPKYPACLRHFNSTTDLWYQPKLLLEYCSTYLSNVLFFLPYHECHPALRFLAVSMVHEIVEPPVVLVSNV